MNLYPQDLRDCLHAIIIRRRAYGVYGGAMPAGSPTLAADLPAPRLGNLGRLWTRGMELTQREAATGLPAASMSLSSAQWTAPVLVGIPLALVALWETTVAFPPNWPLVAEALAAWGAVTGLSMTWLPAMFCAGYTRNPCRRLK